MNEQSKCNQPVAQPVRRRFQFSIRSLLVLTALVAVWLGYETWRARQQQAVEALSKKMGFYHFGIERVPRSFSSFLPNGVTNPYPNVFMDIVAVRCRSNSLTNRDLAELSKVRHLKELHAGGRQIANSDLHHLQGLPELEILGLENSSVGDEGLKILSSLPKLRRLELSDTNITDEGLKPVALVPRLDALNLAGTRVTDNGLRYLSTSRTLRELNLSRTTITKLGLAELGKMRSLRKLTARPSRRPEDSIRFSPQAQKRPHQQDSIWQTIASVRPDVELHLGIQSEVGPEINVLAERGDTEVDFFDSGERTCIDIQCNGGIDKATLFRVGDRWPKAIEIQLHLKGLELFEIVSGPLTLSIADSSDNEYTGRQRLRHNGIETAIDQKSPYYTSTSTRLGRNKIPLEEPDFFVILLPTRLFEANPESIQLRWVDFYRN